MSRTLCCHHRFLYAHDMHPVRRVFLVVMLLALVAAASNIVLRIIDGRSLAVQAGSSETALLAQAGGASANHEKYAPPTVTTNLILVGVMVAGSASTAIITVAGGSQKLYRIGDSVDGNLVLETVFQDRVNLVSGGWHLTLPLTQGTSLDYAVTETDQPAVLHDEWASKTDQADAQAAEAIALWRRSNASRDDSSLGMLTPVPGSGLRVEGVKQRSPYATIGLQAGDVVLSVNGKPMESDEQLMMLYNQMRIGSPQELQVLRWGGAVTIHLDRH